MLTMLQNVIFVYGTFYKILINKTFNTLFKIMITICGKLLEIETMGTIHCGYFPRYHRRTMKLVFAKIYVKSEMLEIKLYEIRF